MGRPAEVGTPRSVKSSFRQTPEERRRLDEARGNLAISDYIRRVVDRDLAEKGIL